MKNILSIFLFSLLLFISCRKRTEAPSVSSALTAKEWRVSFAKEMNTVFTVLYTGYKFKFTADGKLTVNDGTTTYDGTWSENGNNRTLTIDILSSNFELDFISQEWKVNNASLTGVNLKDDLSTTTQELRFSVF